MSKERLEFAARFNEVAEMLGYVGHGKQSSIARTYGLKQPSLKNGSTATPSLILEFASIYAKKQKLAMSGL
jgi:hypothetical protein